MRAALFAFFVGLLPLYAALWFFSRIEPPPPAARADQPFPAAAPAAASGMGREPAAAASAASGPTDAPADEPSPSRASALARGTPPADSALAGSGGAAPVPPALEGPTGRFADAPAREREARALPGGGLLVRYLVESGDPAFPLLAVEEVWRERTEAAAPGPQDAASIGPAAPAWRRVRQSVYLADEIMFEADPAKVDPAGLEAAMAELGLAKIWESRLSHYVQLKLDQPSLAALDAALDALRERFPEAVVSVDHLHFPSAAPDDWKPGLMWNLDQVGATDAWSFAQGSEDVVVAVIDTGLEQSHPDLRENLWVNPGEIPDNGKDDDGNGFVDDVRGWDFVNDDPVTEDTANHGTHVSGTVGARGDNGRGIQGVNWRVGLLPLKAGAALGLSTRAINEALRYVADLREDGVNIVATNNSYGSQSSNTVTRDLITRHQDLGILFVAAAGNDGVDNDDEANRFFPASYPHDNVISVANSTQGDLLNASSNFGAATVDLAAPGSAVYSTVVFGGFDYNTGTSMASPLVAGAAALLASREPDLDWREIKARLLDNARPVPALNGRTLTGGRLDLFAALRPDLAGHRLAIEESPGGLVLLPEAPFEVAWRLDHDPGAILAFEALEGPAAPTSAFEGSTLRLSFPGEGAYRIRVEATKEGVVRRQERTVLAGPPADVRSGLLHAWDFEGSGDAEPDRAGSGDGALVNATRVASPLGKGVRFSGSDSRMEFPAGSGARVTLSAFVRNDNLSSSPHPRIVNTPDYFLYFSTRSGAFTPDGNANTLKFFANRTQDFGVWNAPPDSIRAGEWLHVAAAYDSGDADNLPQLYINGVPQIARTQRPPVGAQTLGGGAAFLGDNSPTDDTERPWEGLMDEVRIYRRALSPAEIGALAAVPKVARWERFAVAQEGDAVLGQPIRFALEDAEGMRASGNLRWEVAGPEGGFAFNDASGPEAEIVFSEPGEYRTRVRLTDAYATQYWERVLAFEAVEFEAGRYSGAFGDGGLVWVSVDPSRDSGYVTAVDPASGFARFREPIEVRGDGSFATSAAFSGRLVGSLDGDSLTGRVEDRDLAFEASRISPASEATGFDGRYVGGALEQASDRIELRVLEAGEAFLSREGFVFDLAQGMLDSSGSFRLASATGRLYTGQVDPQAGQVRGLAVEEGGEERPFFLQEESAAPPNRFVNLSTRGLARTGEGTLIGGFVVQGDQPQRLLLRAVGPSLPPDLVPDRLADPRIELRGEGGGLLASNEDWGAAPNPDALAAAFGAVGAGAFPQGSRDAAMLVELDPGAYTALVTPAAGVAPGEALFEVFSFADSSEPSLLNVSTRGLVQGTRKPLIAGFVITGEAPKQALIRAVGPSLANLEVANPLGDPRLVLNASGTNVALSDDWQDGLEAGPDGAEPPQGPPRLLEEAFAQAGALPLDPGSADAAMLVWLEPGKYTALVTGAQGSEGVALVEVFELADPPPSR